MTAPSSPLPLTDARLAELVEYVYDFATEGVAPELHAALTELRARRAAEEARRRGAEEMEDAAWSLAHDFASRFRQCHSRTDIASNLHSSTCTELAGKIASLLAQVRAQAMEEALKQTPAVRAILKSIGDQFDAQQVPIGGYVDIRLSEDVCREIYAEIAAIRAKAGEG